MPIKDLMDTRGRLPRLGVIKVGIIEVSSQGHEYAKETDYFVIPEELQTILGAKPKIIPVLFPSDDSDRICTYYYEKWGGGAKNRGGKLLRRCDGDEYVEFAKDGTVLGGTCEKPGPRLPCPCGAKARAHLTVIIPQGPIGTWWVMTGGEQRIADLLGELELYKLAFGRLTGIVFQLERVKTDVTVVTDKGRITKAGYPIHIKCAVPTLEAFAVRGTPLASLPGGQIFQSLVAASLEEHEDEAVIEGEDENGQLAPAGASPAQVSDAASPVGTRPAVPPLSPAESSESGAPLSQGGRASATPAGGRDDLEEWTIETCFEAVGHLGMTPDDYRAYLLGVYSVDEHNLAQKDLLEQIGLLRDALASPKGTGAALVGAIRTVAEKVRRRQKR